MKKIEFALILLLLPTIAGAEIITGGGSGGGGGGSGTVTSIAAGCGASASPSPITTTGTMSAQDTPTTLTGNGVPITTGYCGGTEFLSNGSNQVPTIAV